MLFLPRQGEHGVILKELHSLAIQVTEMQTTQTLNHADNKQDIAVLFKQTDKLNHLPCEKHIEKFRAYDNFRKALIGTICTVVIAIVGFAVAWGALKERVGQHEIYSKRAWENCCAEAPKERTIQGISP